MNITVKDIHTVVRVAVILVLLSLHAVTGHGQHDEPGQLPGIMPPSPNAFAITRYGGISVGLQTGTPQIEIPVFNISSRNLNLPVKITYSTNGIKVDENASRVGMSWILNAGGVITCSVIDDPDGYGTPVAPPNFAVQDRALINWLNAASMGNDDRNDLSPDIFSFNFNGFSGRFILNGNKVVPLEKTNLKFETESASGWTFKVTDPAGIAYYFGEGNATESSKTASYGTEGCGKSYMDFVPTAWYVSRIVHPNGDVITLNYQRLNPYSYATGVSQTLTKLTDPMQRPCTNGAMCAAIPDADCKSMSTVNSVYLSEIVSTSNERIAFSYVSRTDLPGDVLLDKISLYLPGDAVNAAKTAQCAYQYATAANYTNSYTDATLRSRPFLTAISMQDKNKTSVQRHAFQYNDINALPPKLSYAQDHFGFFNGASNNNLLPKPASSYLSAIFPSAYANRTPDFSSGSKGMLTKLIYPTGGYDTLIYAPPTTYVTEPAPPIATVLSASAQGDASGSPVTRVSEVLTVNDLVDPNAKLGMEFIYGGNPDELDFHYHANVTMTDITDNKVIYSSNMNSDNPRQVIDVGLLLNHKYTVKVDAYGQYTIGNIVLTYNRSTGMVSYNKTTGGVVIDKVKTYDPTSNKFNVKRYYYAALTDMAKSTGRMSFAPQYYSSTKMRVNCGTTACDYGPCDYSVLTSYSLLNLYAYSQSHIYFQKVVESLGENFEGGATEHQYEISPDLPGEMIMGNDILSSPFSNRGFMNGKETHLLSVIKSGANYIPVKEVTTNYADDSRLSELFYGYTVRKIYDPICTGSSVPTVDELGAYDVKRHYIYSRWIYPASITTTIYDVNGQNPYTTTVSYGYGNVQHLLPTTITQNSSKQEVMKTVNQYPQDVNTAGLEASAATAIAALIERHINPVVITEQYRGSKLMNRMIQNYKVWDNGLVAMQNVQSQEANYPMETRIVFTKYGPVGNILEQAKANDISQVYLWGYNNRYPVAFVTGSNYATVSSLVNLNVLQSPSTEEAIRAELSKLRNALKGKALVVTATYIPSVGMSSKTDPAGIEEFYEYDNYQRLRLIRDQHKNIIKLFCYNYAGMPLACPDAGY
jgi:hypothetical protein